MPPLPLNCCAAVSVLECQIHPDTFIAFFPPRLHASTPDGLKKGQQVTPTSHAPAPPRVARRVSSRDQKNTANEREKVKSDHGEGLGDEEGEGWDLPQKTATDPSLAGHRRSDPDLSELIVSTPSLALAFALERGPRPPFLLIPPNCRRLLTPALQARVARPS